MPASSVGRPALPLRPQGRQGMRRHPEHCWNIADSYDFIARFCTRYSQLNTGRSHAAPPHRPARPAVSTRFAASPWRGRRPTLKQHGFGPSMQWIDGRRCFHDYFVTHLPSSSLHPESRTSVGPHHRLPRAASIPHPSGSGPSPAAPPPMHGHSRELTVVRIPLRSAKHHFGVAASRGTRPYNEDTYQAGVIELPAFARKAPMSLTRSAGGLVNGEGTSAQGASGDPQVFYFGVFDGHGGAECSLYLRDRLHSYIETTAAQFGLSSSLRPTSAMVDQDGPRDTESVSTEGAASVGDLQQALVSEWKETVGGYFKRFKPQYFQLSNASSAVDRARSASASASASPSASLESVLTYSFLKADLDFIMAQVQRADDDPVQNDKALNEGEILGEASRPRSGPRRFKGGSTCSVAMISTPTPTPFWNPASPSSLVVSHVGDTRILLCSTSDGVPVPLTANHHPASPTESGRLRRYAATFVTDSFGEERMTGLANTRAFGDLQSKRIGVSAEPEIRRVELKPAEYSFLVLMSDGISGTLNDQEVVDIVKEAKTPDEGAKDVVAFATEVSQEGDNATCLVVRLGGWERRLEGGLGAMGTREARDWRRQDATNSPRNRRA